MSIDHLPLESEESDINLGLSEHGPSAEAAVTHPQQSAEPLDEEEDDSEDLGLRPTSLSDYLRGFSACLISMAFHIACLVGLGLIAIDNSIKAEIRDIIASPIVERPEDEPVEIELNEQIETVETQNVAMMSSAPAMGAVGVGASATVGTPTIDQQVVRESEVSTNVSIDFPTAGIPNPNKLIEAVPDGEVKGEPRAIVGDYQEAMDRLTQELMWMIDKGPTMVVWLFDESGSMKDDQQEIRDRVENVYRQLGIYGRSTSDVLLTAVASYGNGYHIHTPRPTGDATEIRKAIDAIPVDETGKEMMCQAIGQSIRDFRKFAQRRQMAMILVTDETGERENNDRFLELALSEAKSANCKIFVLGRESVFGYPYAYISWRHPTTRRVHWLQMDRGPETGFPEQLQTDGLHRRYDAFSSGFGPYEQCRLARDTNGVFFMLPSEESNLVHAQKHRYELEAMRPFRPDLRSRAEVFADRDKFPLRTLIWKVITDLNPWNPQAAKTVELQVDNLSLNPQELAQQIRTNQQKAIVLLRYLADAQKAMESGKKLREQEADPRWQANYDLIYAQIVAYQARIYEYGAGLEPYLTKPPTAPATKGNLVLMDWNVATRAQTLTKEALPYIEKANELLKGVSKDFSGTPWGARADWELKRGYGIHLVPDYEEPYVNDPKAMPPPKL